MTLTVRAFAKINLTLRVLGTRADGYHELRTTFQSLALHDTLVISRETDRFAIECTDPDVPTGAENLVWKAAALLAERLPRRGSLPRGALPPAHVRLVKRIPAQSGLGGGSSDAAAALRALNQLWRLSLPEDELTALARRLGADVPFFLTGGTALGIDRGDVLFQLEDQPRSYVVVARPPFGVSTADAYRWWDAWRGDRRPPRPGGRLPWLPASECRNDLEPPVVAQHPRIGRLVRALRAEGARFGAMSGSGSAVFGLFSDRNRARAAVRRSVSLGATALLTRTMGGGEYRRLSEPHAGARRSRKAKSSRR